MIICHKFASMKIIRSIDELVDEFGGDTSLAEYLGISQSAVAQWKIRGSIAAGWHLRLFAELTKRGRTVHPSVFGLSEAEAGHLFLRFDNRRPEVRAA